MDILRPGQLIWVDYLDYEQDRVEEVVLSKELFREDSYLRTCFANVTLADGNSVCVDQTIFYPLGGGQPGDTGTMVWDAGSAKIVDTRNSPEGIRHVLEEGVGLPPTGARVELELDWDRSVLSLHLKHNFFSRPNPFESNPSMRPRPAVNSPV